MHSVVKFLSKVYATVDRKGSKNYKYGAVNLRNKKLKGLVGKKVAITVKKRK